jgi:4-hydroxybutyrate dehydrogenase
MVKGQKERKNVEKEVLVASNYAGIAFGNAGTAAVHALAYPLSGTYHVAHGEANYQFYSEVLKKYYDKNPKGKIKIFVEFVADILECNANVEVFEKIEELFALMVPKKRLREYGMKESEISSFAISVEKEQQRLLVNNYVFLSVEEFKDIYRTLY